MGKTKKKAVKLTAIETKRVAVLKDAIAQIKIGRYSVESGTGYVDNNTDLRERLEKAADACELFTGKTANEVEFNKFFDKIITPDEPCQVCAKGAMLLSTINKFNNFTLQDAADKNLDHLAGVEDGTHELFGSENADKMEEYFEGNDDYDRDENGKLVDIDNYEGETYKWSDQYPEDDDRLIAIFQNAIRNKGTFKP